QLVVRVKLQLLVVVDGEERVGAPLQLVGRAATWLTAAAPLVAEQQLGAVVVEGRRVPERHVGVGDGVDANRVLGIVDVEQQAEAGARAAREADFRIHGDVVALIRPARRLRLVAAPAAGTAAPRRLPARRRG